MESLRTRSILWLCFTVLATLLLNACGEPAGTPCAIRGSGFTAKHDCQEKCLSRQKVHCPDGTGILPKACSGEQGCMPGSCPDGQACYHIDDPFDVRSLCVMADTCGALTREQVAEWELSSAERAAAIRAKYRKSKAPEKPTVSEPADPDSNEQ